MLVDIRNNKSASSVKIPPKYKAYVYKWSDISEPLIKVIIAESPVHADNYLRDWCYREGLDHDSFFYFLGCVDYEVVGIADDSYYHDLLFSDYVSETDKH